jgi:maltoporin
MIANKSFTNAAKFKYLETTETSKNSIHEEIKSRLNSWNACYRAVYRVSQKSAAMGELGYLKKIWKNVKREKLLKIMCFQSQVFEFCT